MPPRIGYHKDGSVFRPMFPQKGGPEYYNVTNLGCRLRELKNRRAVSNFGGKFVETLEDMFRSWLIQLKEDDFPDGVSDHYKEWVRGLKAGKVLLDVNSLKGFGWVWEDVPPKKVEPRKRDVPKYHKDGSRFVPMFPENGGQEFHNIERMTDEVAKLERKLEAAQKAGYGKRNVYAIRVSMQSKRSWLKQLRDHDIPDELDDEYKEWINALWKGQNLEKMRQICIKNRENLGQDPETGECLDQESLEARYPANALGWACETGDASVVKRLLESGLDVNVTDDYGHTALSNACSRGNPEIVKLLLDAGAEVDHFDRWGETPIVTVLRGGGPGDNDRSEIMTLLAEAGANVKVHDARGRSLLTLAVIKGRLQAASNLIANGWADVNEKDDNGDTALQAAVRHGRVNIIRILLDFGADASSVSYENLDNSYGIPKEMKGKIESLLGLKGP